MLLYNGRKKNIKNIKNIKILAAGIAAASLACSAYAAEMAAPEAAPPEAEAAAPGLPAIAPGEITVNWSAPDAQGDYTVRTEKLVSEDGLDVLLFITNTSETGVQVRAEGILVNAAGEVADGDSVLSTMGTGEEAVVVLHFDDYDNAGHVECRLTAVPGVYPWKLTDLGATMYGYPGSVVATLVNTGDDAVPGARLGVIFYGADGQPVGLHVASADGADGTLAPAAAYGTQVDVPAQYDHAVAFAQITGVAVEPDGKKQAAAAVQGGTSAEGMPSGAEASGAETAGAGTPGAEASGAEAPASGTPGTEASGAEAPASGTPGTEASGAEAPASGTPGTEVSGAEVPGTEAPGTEAPGTEAPAAEVAVDEAVQPELDIWELPLLRYTSTADYNMVVRNLTDRPLRLKGNAIGFDSQGLAVAAGDAAIAVLGPNELGVVNFYLKPAGELAFVSASLTSDDEPVRVSAQPWLVPEVLPAANGQITLKVTNTGDREVQFPDVTVLFFDAEGTISGYAHSYLGESFRLGSGQAAETQLSAHAPYASYHFYLSGYLAG